MKSRKVKWMEKKEREKYRKENKGKGRRGEPSEYSRKPTASKRESRESHWEKNEKLARELSTRRFVRYYRDNDAIHSELGVRRTNCPHATSCDRKLEDCISCAVCALMYSWNVVKLRSRTD